MDDPPRYRHPHPQSPFPSFSPCPKLRHSHASPLGTCGVTTKIRQAKIGKLTLVLLSGSCPLGWNIFETSKYNQGCGGYIILCVEVVYLYAISILKKTRYIDNLTTIPNNSVLQAKHLGPKFYEKHDEQC